MKTPNREGSHPVGRHGPSDHKNSSLLFHVDAGFPQKAFDGCLLLRGWCADPSDPVKEVRVVLPGVMAWPGHYGQPRPDVPAALPECPTPNCGFEICLKLPVGRYSARLEIEHTSGKITSLDASKLHVSRRKRLAFLLWGSPENMLRFQLLAGPSHPPRSLGNLSVRPHCIRLPRLRYPWFSIVTPSFNQAPYLGETMRSVLSQKGVRVHYVIQDGGSTDGSVSILKRCVNKLDSDLDNTDKGNPEDLNCNLPDEGSPPQESSRFSVEWESIPDFGQTAAINRAFSKTDGAPEDLMAWINSDDFYLPGAFAYVADYFARNPKVDAVYGHRLLVDEDSREVGRWHIPAHDDDVLKLYDFIPQETLFWRRRVWERVGGLDPTFKFAMDWDFLLRLGASKANIVRLPRLLACFRLHRTQKTMNLIRTEGQEEIEKLRARSTGRVSPPSELLSSRAIHRYLRSSANREILTELCPRFRLRPEKRQPPSCTFREGA